MSEPRKNHLNIDGGQVMNDENEHIGSYKPLPQGDGDFRVSRSSLGKSKEKVSVDGAEEKLLQDAEEGKIITKVNMTDAKYVVGDHRNGDAKIELDANKKMLKLWKLDVYPILASKSSLIFLQRPSKLHRKKRRHHHKTEKKTDNDKPKDAEQTQEPTDTPKAPEIKETRSAQGPSGIQDAHETQTSEKPKKHHHHHHHKKRHHHHRHKSTRVKGSILIKKTQATIQDPPVQQEEEPPKFVARRSRRMSFHPALLPDDDDDDDDDEPLPTMTDEDRRRALLEFVRLTRESVGGYSGNWGYVQFSGLTKEELLKYQDDPFWVRLRWTLFVLFWLLWLCMLAGAVTIIIRAPKCSPPAPKTWYEKSPLVDMAGSDYSDIESKLPILKSSGIEAVFVPTEPTETYKVLDEPSALDTFKKLVEKAKEYGVKLIVDLSPNFVSTSHPWFTQSENRSAQYDKYFIWADGKGFDADGKKNPPSNWRSTVDTSAWRESDIRKQFYLQQHGGDTADLNFNNTDVVAKFDEVLKEWMQAGAAGVRLQNSRRLLVSSPFLDDPPQPATSPAARAADHSQYPHYAHKYTSDQPGVDDLLVRWSRLVADASTVSGGSVFTIQVDPLLPPFPAWSRSGALVTSLRPRTAAARLQSASDALALQEAVKTWPAIELKSPEANSELALFSLLLPAAPVLDKSQLPEDINDTLTTSFKHLVSLRSDPSIEHGEYNLYQVPLTNTTEKSLIAITRLKLGHTGYLAVYNPSVSDTASGPATADVSGADHVPATLAVHLVSAHTHALTNYSTNTQVNSKSVLVPPKSTVVLSFVPKTSAEQ